MAKVDKFKNEIDSLHKDIYSIVFECSEREQIFILEYLKDFSKKKAYKRAFPESDKLTYNTLQTSSSKLYHKLEDRIEKIADIMIRKTAVETLQIITRLKNAATFNQKDLFDENGNLKNIHDMPDSITCLMEGFEIVKKYDTEKDENGDLVSIPIDVIKTKFPSRMKAEEMLSKYYELYSDKVELTGFTSLVDLVKKKFESDAK